MSFSEEWDKIYSKGQQIAVWPWSDLISYVIRYSKPDKTPFSVLELGCGAAANIPFFKRLGVDYYGLEGSPSIVNQLHTTYPDLKDKIIAADFTTDFHFEKKFDLIFDRASVTHNNSDSIVRCISLVKSHLKPNGKYIGIDWFSTMHDHYQEGDFDGDRYTRSSIPIGQFQGVGKVHFSDKAHLEDLFREFEIIQLDHKIVKTEIPDTNHTFASWNFVAQNNR